MDKLTGHSPDLVERNIERLKEFFPSVVTEGVDESGRPVERIDFDALRQELSDHVVEGPDERFQLDWPGKRRAALAANAPVAKTLRPQHDESVDFDTTRNLFIEGDNLDVLKLLQESYLGKVKLIYIDPPYNTGNDFIYNDDFAESKQEYLERSGQVDEAGNRLVANTEANGRFHSDWLSMMYPRLKLARHLLTDDGVIFISINDAEVSSLQKLANQVFGEANFVASMVWAAGRKNDSHFISASHEFILCYARSHATLQEQGIRWRTRKKGLDRIYAEADRLVELHHGDFTSASKGMKQWFKNLPDSDDAKRSSHYSSIDTKGVYFPDNISWPGGGGPKYEVLHPVTRRPVKIPSRGWLFQKDVMQAHIDAGKVEFGADEKKVPTFKRYLKDTEFEVPYSVFYQDGRAASKRLRSLMGSKVFDFPKDETVIQTLIQMITVDDDIVMDFFGGSGTTAHAVMAMNAADGGARPYVMVQLNEAVEEGSAAAEAGFASIADLARERIRRAGAKIVEEAGLQDQGLDVGFRSLRVDSSGRTDVFATADDTS